MNGPFCNLIDLVDEYGCEYIIRRTDIRMLVYAHRSTDEIKLGQLLEYRTPDIEFRLGLINNFIDTVTKYLSNPTQYSSVSLIENIECECSCLNDTVIVTPMTPVTIRADEDQLVFIVGRLIFKECGESCYFLFPRYCRSFFVGKHAYLRIVHEETIE